jgi:hypothetical protein
VPTDRGIAPGNGALVGVLEAASGRHPDVVAGKPYRPLFDETVRRTSAQRPIMVGDRLDTDIEGAIAWGADSLLVMTGVTDVPALCRAPSGSRPLYVSWTLQGLLTPHRRPQRGDGAWSLSDWEVATDDGTLVVRRTGSDADEGLRTVAVAAWHFYDASGADAALDTSGLDDIWPAG